MPNRLLREGIVDSRKMGAISDGAKVLYYKLISVVDDFGRFEADCELLRRRLYSWETEKVNAKSLDGYLQECANGDDPLIRLYVSGKKRYLEILNFRQQLRAKSKFPDETGEYTKPPKLPGKPVATQLPTIDSNCEQMQTNALVPTRLDSTRIDSTLNSSSQEQPSPDVPMDYSYQPDGWAEAVEAASRAQMTLDPSPDSQVRKYLWTKLSMEDRLLAVRGIVSRVECGQYSPDEPHYIPTFENYIRGHKWGESLRPRRPPQSATPIDRYDKLAHLRRMADGTERAG